MLLIGAMGGLYSPAAGYKILTDETSSSPVAGYQELTDETSRLWFVELTSAPLADATVNTLSPSQQQDYLNQLESEKQAFRNASVKSGVSFTERFSFNVLWNGLSIEVDPVHLATLARISGVQALYPVMTVSIPEVEQSLENPELLTALAMTGADVAQSELGLTGAGVRVAVMDTGVDYQHPDLGGCFGPGCRVEVGFDFVGDAFNADPTSPTFSPVPVPDPDPDDCNGHGTHVSGIVGANGGVKGVAPGVTFGAYRVFGCAGSTTADIMIAAMEKILADGADILNMSIGAAFQWPQYPTARASDRLVNKGIVVVASIGNSAAAGVYSAGAPGLGEKVIGVASFDNTHVGVLSFTVNPGDRRVGYIPLSGATPEPRTSGTTPDVVFVGRGCNADAYLANPSGKVALIVRGVCTFNEKYQRAANNGAVGVVIHNNSPGIFAGTISPGPSRDIFGLGISQADGQHIRSLLSAGTTVTLTWTADLASVPNPTGGLLSSFSSYGLSPDLALKPDIGAPGGLIRSTLPLERGSYGVLSGTSMSSPHVAGGVALLLEALPDTPSQAVRSILQSTADPRPWFGNPGLGFLDNVHRQGAGMLDIDDAILTTTRIELGKLSLGESEAGPATRTLTLRNRGQSDVTYTLSHSPALSTSGSTFSPSFVTGFASVVFSKDGMAITQVTVPARAETTVDATITANPALASRSQYGGYLVLTPSGGSPLRVPYAGFKGDYQSILVLNPTPAGFPWLAKFNGTHFFKQSAGASYTFENGDIPYILVHLDHQVRRLRAEVFDANTGKAWQRAFEFQYVGRNSAATSFFAISWDGLTTAGRRTITVPDGQYIIRLSVQKALGDDDNPAHWETWDSPSFIIDRPGISTFTVPGDVDRDWDVDVSDLAILGASWGATPQSPNWNPSADFNQDGTINVLDLAQLGSWFGWRL